MDFQIVLNSTFEYALLIFDPVFGFPTLNPAAVPRALLPIQEKSMNVFYIKVLSLFCFLAPTGALGMSLYVCPTQVCPELSFFIFLTL